MGPKNVTLLIAAVVVAAAATGCAKDDRSSSSSTTTATGASAPAAPGATSAGSTTAMNKVSGSAQGDVAHGRTVFTAQCASCHGANGVEGGVGPSLKNEKSRKNYAQAVGWIKNPVSPMPKLFPDSISERDVADVAAYVETL